MDTQLELKERIEQALYICRPYLKSDGGDIKLVRILENGIVELQFLGTCVNCPLSLMTLRAGIERVILKLAPEIHRVEIALQKNTQ